MTEVFRIPVIIISGFLGSGKTTLLNYIISKNRDTRIGIIVNDFGEIDVDSNLIVSSSDQILEISNGCICCSNNGDLRATIAKLLRDNVQLDYIIIESTGIGDPLPILKTFMRPEFVNQTRVDSIITVVDSEYIRQSLLDSNVAQNQVKFADFILLNKCDLVQRHDIDSVKSLVRQINSDCRIVEVIKCSVELDFIIGGRSHIEMKIAQHHNTPAHYCDHECNDHDLINHGFMSVCFSSNELLNPQKFQEFLQKIPTDVFRGKGFLKTTQSDQSYIFHLIAKRFTLDLDKVKKEPCNQLVFIGRHFDRNKLIDDLKGCFASTN